MNHLRPHARATPDLRDGEALGWLTSRPPRSTTSRTPATSAASPRPVAGGRGRHNIPNVGIFLWRTDAVDSSASPLVAPRRTAAGSASTPLGADAPLFGRAAHRGRHHPPRRAVRRAAAAGSALPVGAPRRPTTARVVSLLLERQAARGRPGRRAAGGRPDLRPVRRRAAAPGRTSHPPARSPSTPCSAACTSAPRWQPERARWRPTVRTGRPGRGRRLRTAARLRSRTRCEPVVRRRRSAAAAQRSRAGGTVAIGDSERYAGTPTITTTSARARRRRHRGVGRAADRTRARARRGAAVKLAMDPRTTVVLDGLLISGGPVVLEESGDAEPRTIMLRNCTLVPGQTAHPGRPARAARPRQPDRARPLRRRAARAVRARPDRRRRRRVRRRDRLRDRRLRPAQRSPSAAGSDRAARCARSAASPTTSSATALPTGGNLDLHECTVHRRDPLPTSWTHPTRCSSPDLASGDPRKAAVWAQRRQVGCVRFSFCRVASRTGKRYRCAPDPDAPPDVQLATRPQFTSLRFGDPAYLQLTREHAGRDPSRRGRRERDGRDASAVRTAARGESPLRLDEYLRFGLKPVSSMPPDEGDCGHGC